MNNYSYPYQGATSQYGQIQSMFPQPQGNVYSINTPLDIGGVPIGSAGLSVALCLKENLMYIKSFQNGNPVIMAYSIQPFNPTSQAQKTPKTNQDDLAQKIEQLEEELNKLKQPNKGELFNGLL